MADSGLIRWGRAAHARRGGPVLWLFTDSARLPDPLPAARALPAGCAGVVLRHDHHPDRPAIGRALAAICRQRRLVLVVAGDARLAHGLGAGVHLRAGRWPGPYRPPLRQGAFVTSSAHRPAELRRAAGSGARLAFVSPAFPTASHPSAPALGPSRWTALSRRVSMDVAALGGIDGRSIRRLGSCAGAAAITALA